MTEEVKRGSLKRVVLCGAGCVAMGLLSAGLLKSELDEKKDRVVPDKFMPLPENKGTDIGLKGWGSVLALSASIGLGLSAVKGARRLRKQDEGR